MYLFFGVIYPLLMLLERSYMYPLLLLYLALEMQRSRPHRGWIDLMGAETFICDVCRMFLHMVVYVETQE